MKNTKKNLSLLIITSIYLSCSAYNPIRIATGAASKYVCSGVFISNLDPDRVYEETLRPATGMGLVDWALRYRVDQTRKEVTANFAGGSESRSRYREGMGCLLANDIPENISAKKVTLPNSPATLSETAWPELVEPATAGLRLALDRAFEESSDTPHRWTRAVVIIHNGKLIAERYSPGYSIRSIFPGNSLTKSTINAIAGILVKQGKLSIESPVRISAWQKSEDPRSKITTDQLMRMSSGLPLDEPSFRLWFTESNMDSYAQSFSLEQDPGTKWNYSNAGYQILSRIVRDSTGRDAQTFMEFVHRELFAPLGIKKATLTFDSSDIPVGSNGMFASARDWALLGMLYLNDGFAGRKRILPDGWLKYSTMQTLDTGYGAGFWLNVTDNKIPQFGIRWGMPHAPKDTFFGRGHLGQYIVIIPSKKLVIVRLGVSHGRGGEIESVGQLVSDVIADLEK
ncbi:beta-lactamase [Leptospira broomii serovar Hurstbridge str. 5399]|uniref:Beta-lactamase n=1 Tax=Leptospira broomii serovar Hurstbridge str. 5399 TaxID=1049789 RepID=T0FAZ4_9LEPT|nr:serine hydrolase [Leptospira broomii]EQA45041.1 beta-lactamase [Leptospira broomii serovar Hurstbridge str. 5399]